MIKIHNDLLKARYTTIGNETFKTIEAWENSETTAAIVGGEAFAIVWNRSIEEESLIPMFDFPVKILTDVRIDRVDLSYYKGRRFVAIRTDCYPLLWILLWIQLRIEAKIRRDIMRTILIASLFGWTKHIDQNQYISWRDLLFIPDTDNDF